jgi:outer membrane protein
MNKIILILFFGFYVTLIDCQTSKVNSGFNNPGDSLTLNYVINEVIRTHPSIKESEEAVHDADTKINLARTGYYPNADITGSYTRIGPVSSITIPELGSFTLFPEDNYSFSLNVNENIFDFGKTSRKVDYESGNKILAEEKFNMVRQNLSLMTINSFFNISYLQDAIAIKDEQLQNLQEHLDFVTKKTQTGSAIQYEILTTRVKISAVQSQKIDLETSLNIQKSVLNSLLGFPAESSYNVKKENSESVINVQSDSLISYAEQHRDEMKIAKENSSLAELYYNVVKAQNYPLINIFTSGGWKNGYIPDLKKLTANFAVGVGITLPIFDAGRNKNNLLLAKSSMLEKDMETEITRRKIKDDVVRSEENLKAAQKKVDQFKLQLTQAEQAYSLAEVNYQAGAITNIDLLDASTNVSESRLMLLKAEIDYVVSVYRLKAALGQRLY